MTPVVFDGCFGWLHEADGSRGVVLCGAHGYEDLSVHRQWKGLAERLAAAGLPTLRFDYRGTGDSIGHDEEPQRLRAWIDSIKDAVRWMREQTGVTEVALVGLRIGGTLATLAAKELGDVDVLALLAPAVTGRAWTREMKALAAFSPRPADAAPEASASEDIEAGGFVLTAETVASLKDVDLRQLERRPAKRVLLMEPADAPAGSRLDRSLRDLGADVQVTLFRDFDRFICEVIHGQRTPEAAFATLTGWLRQGMPPVAVRSEPRAIMRLEMPEAIETPVFFDDGARLFGIACEPRPQAADHKAPAVIFINTGHHRHINVSRMAVTLGRRLAAQGITSMRIDVAGLGDSPDWPGRPENAVYDKAACADVRAAMDCLEAQGHREFVLVGLCSGAYVSFYTALQDTRVTSQVMVNLQKFVWRDGDSLEVTTHTTSKRTRDLGSQLAGALRRREKWLGLLRGNRKEWITVWAILKRSGELGLSAAGRLAHAWFGVEGEIGRSFRLLAQLGTDTVLVYSGDDGGLVELEVHNLWRHGSGLRGHERVTVEIIEGADHTLTLRPARERLARIIEAHLGARQQREAPARHDSGSTPQPKEKRAA